MAGVFNLEDDVPVTVAMSGEVFQVIEGEGCYIHVQRDGEDPPTADTENWLQWDAEMGLFQNQTTDSIVWARRYEGEPCRINAQ